MSSDVVADTFQAGNAARAPRQRGGPDEDLDCFALAAGTCRFWRPGDLIRPGERLGATVDGGRPVHARDGGRVTTIEYDVDRDEVILFVRPLR